MGEPKELQRDLIYESRGDTYRLEVLRAPELGALLPLFADAFGHAFEGDWLSRKYACEHGGVGGFCCAAFAEDGSPAGSVGVLPWGVRFGDRVETAGQMVDVATGSAHRGRGLFVRLAEMAREACESAGVAFLFGFPNEAAYPIWLSKLGYEHTDDLVEYRVPVRTLWLERIARRAGPMRSVYEAYARRTLRAHESGDLDLENSLVREGFAGVDRDRAFYDYKSAFAGSRMVAGDGGRVWLNVRHGIQVGDLEAVSAEDVEKTLRGLRRLARRLGVHQIVFQVSKESRFTLLLAPYRHGEGLPVIHRGLGSRIPSDRLRYSFGDLDNF